MLRILVERFWPVLLPLVLYLGWLALARRKAHKAGTDKPGFFDGPWLWPVVATLLMTIAGFILLGLSEESSDGVYVPAHQENGTLVPAQILPKPQE